MIIIQAFTESLQTEADYVTDSFLILILLTFKMSEDSSQQTYYYPYITIIACIKLSYFYDIEKSLNFQIDPTLA